MLVPESLRCTSHDGEKGAVKAGKGRKPGLHGNIQNAFFSADEQITCLADADIPDILFGGLVEVFPEFIQKLRL